MLKTSLTILLTFCVFTLNAQKVFFSANNNEVNRVVQSQQPPLITAGLIQNLDANLTNSYGGSGNIWTDIVGGNNGTIFGGTFTTTGGISFFNFPNVSGASYVSAPLTKSTSMTFNIWVKVNSVPVPNTMVFNAGNVAQIDINNIIIGMKFSILANLRRLISFACLKNELSIFISFAFPAMPGDL